MSDLVGGIFVGGASRRMGGFPKGLVRLPSGETLVLRAHRLLSALGARVVLVGDHPAYRDLGFPMLADATPGQGPLGGLLSLLEEAGGGPAVALACDMPRVSRAILDRLAAHAPEAPAVAARLDGRWEPFLARYDAARVLPIARTQQSAGQLSLAALLDLIPAAALDLDEGERTVVEDWDDWSSVQTGLADAD